MCEVTVLGGLTIEVEYDWNGYDNRDCGGGHGVVDDWWIVGIAGRSLRKGEKCDWLYKRIRDAGEEEKIIDACYDHHQDW